MPTTCTFAFDRLDPVYFSGETVQGEVQLTTTSEKNVREVYVEFVGEARVSWSEQESRQRDGKTETYTEYYKGSQSYISSRTQVIGGGVLTPGTRTFNFMVTLPPHCPSSCVEGYGSISYKARVVLNRAYRFDNEFVKPFTVIRQLNCNTMPELLIPINLEDTKYFCCWPCSSGPVITTVKIPFGGYCSGQKINYEIEVDNQAVGDDLNDGVDVKFKQIYRFEATHPRNKHKYQTNTLASSHKPLQCLRLSKRVIRDSLLIPPVPPTIQDGIIQVTYIIRVEIITGACHTNHTMDIPIVIGTIPLAQSATNPDNVAIMLPTAPTDTPDGDKPPGYEFHMPPSFEEATSISRPYQDPDANQYNNIEGFIPKYPMYSNFAGATAPPLSQDPVQTSSRTYGWTAN